MKMNPMNPEPDEGPQQVMWDVKILTADGEMVYERGVIARDPEEAGYIAESRHPGGSSMGAEVSA